MSKTAQIILQQRECMLALDSVCSEDTHEFDWIEIFVQNKKAEFRSYTSHLLLKYEIDIESCTIPEVIIKLSSKKLSEYIRCLPPERLELTFHAEESLEVRTENSFATFPVYLESADRNLIKPSSLVSVQIKRDLLGEWLKSFDAFIRPSDVRVYLTGAFISLSETHPAKKGVICLSGTVSDGLTLAHSVLETFQIEVVNEGKDRILLPKKMIDRLKVVCGQKKEDFFLLSWNEQEMYFSAEGKHFEMEGRTIMGDVKFALPALLDDEKLGVLKVGRNDLLSKLKRVMLFTDNNLKTISLRSDGQDKMVFTALQAQAGGAEEWLSIQSEGKLPEEIFYQGSCLMKVGRSLSSVNELSFCWKNGYDLLMVYPTQAAEVFSVYYLASAKVL